MLLADVSYCILFIYLLLLSKATYGRGKGCNLCVLPGIGYCNAVGFWLRHVIWCGFSSHISDVFVSLLDMKLTCRMVISRAESCAGSRLQPSSDILRQTRHTKVTCHYMLLVFLLRILIIIYHVKHQDGVRNDVCNQ